MYFRNRKNSSNKVEKKELEHARDQLKQFNVNVIGVVMTRMPVTKKYYSYDYGYTHSNDKKSKRSLKR